LHPFACPSSGEGNSNGGSIHVVRHFGNEHNVVVAESEPCCLNSALKFFYGWANGIDSILWIVDYRLPALSGVGDLVQKMWHGDASSYSMCRASCQTTGYESSLTLRFGCSHVPAVAHTLTKASLDLGRVLSFNTCCRLN